MVNASISGETTAGGWPPAGRPRDPRQPSVVVIEARRQRRLRGLPVKAMATNLQAMVDASRKAGAQVLLVGMRMPPNYGPEYTSRFEAAYRDIARPTACASCPS